MNHSQPVGLNKGKVIAIGIETKIGMQVCPVAVRIVNIFLVRCEHKQIAIRVYHCIGRETPLG